MDLVSLLAGFWPPSHKTNLYLYLSFSLSGGLITPLKMVICNTEILFLCAKLVLYLNMRCQGQFSVHNDIPIFGLPSIILQFSLSNILECQTKNFPTVRSCNNTIRQVPEYFIAPSKYYFLINVFVLGHQTTV